MHHEPHEVREQVHDQVLLALVALLQVLMELHLVQLKVLVGLVREEVVVLGLNEWQLHLEGPVVQE